MRALVAVLLVAQLSLSGCSTAMMLKQQQLQLLNAEYTNLQATNKLLSTAPDPEILGQASAFVSLAAINGALSGADNISGPIPSVAGATFHVDSVRAAFSDGFPQLAIKAWAEKGSLKVTLTVTAVLQPIISPSNPSIMQLQINLLKVVPVVQFSIFHFTLWGFAQDLVHAQLQDYVNTLPKLTIPLQSALQLSNPAGSPSITSSTPAGQVVGTVSYNGFAYQGTLQVDNTLFLSDGIHVFLSLH